MILARPRSRWLWAPITLPIIMALMGCASTGIALPYVAQIETLNPHLPGLEIRATAGGGGELEIINRTGQDMTLLDQQGNPYARLVPDGTYELLGGTWVKTKDTPVYYCHDPRLAYDGPEPVTRKPQVIKRWTIMGQIGNQTFTINGQTVYIPHQISGPSMICMVAGMALGCLGVPAAGILIFRAVNKKRTTASQTHR